MQTTELLTYLEREKALVEADIRQIDAMDLPERAQRGLAVVGLRPLRQDGVEVLLACEENLTRWKPGDWVEISLNGRWSTATIAENSFSEILVLLHTYFDVQADTQIVLQSNKSQLLDPIIQSVRRLEPGAPGAAFLDLLWGERQVNPQQFGGLELSEESLAAITGQLNESQRRVVRRGTRRPSLLAVQGPPGTGKTHVLALTAQQLALIGLQHNPGVRFHIEVGVQQHQDLAKAILGNGSRAPAPVQTDLHPVPGLPARQVLLTNQQYLYAFLTQRPQAHDG